MLVDLTFSPSYLMGPQPTSSLMLCFRNIIPWDVNKWQPRSVEQQTCVITHLSQVLETRLRLSASGQPRSSKWWLGFKILLFQICIIDTPRLQSTEKCIAMMICSSFSGLLPPLSSVHNSKNKSNFR